MTRINPFQDVLYGIPTKTFLFCHTIYPQMGMIKNPWEYSSEFSQSNISLCHTGKKARTKDPTKAERRIFLNFNMDLNSSAFKSFCSLMALWVKLNPRSYTFHKSAHSCKLEWLLILLACYWAYSKRTSKEIRERIPEQAFVTSKEPLVNWMILPSLNTGIPAR